MCRDRQHNNRALYKLKGDSMKIGDLVIIRTSFNQKLIGKMAIVVQRRFHWNATIFIIDTGEKKEYDTRKLEVIA